ncbi:MAG TPA: 4'-phosphopantetheinyl transferase superfamily protein [Myxococcales bacterium]|jgi:4'-phosphopantetheinyl transferase|nr:4'-phosphopantetheinyl transferase superfamily protein [Myxococcales bacterium]
MNTADASATPPSFPPDWKPLPGSGPGVVPGDGEALLVLAQLDVPPQRLDALRASFAPREEERFRSFATDALRSRWGAARGTLREVLGAAVGCAPREVAFRYAAHGKPQLANSPLRFNISHSGAVALIAVARVEVGVDVELPRPRRSDGIARRFFAPGEIERLFAIEDPERRADAFFRLWTCKEAFLKVTGEGLSRSTRSYEIAPDSSRLLWAVGIPDAATRYSVYPLDVGDPYRAALVAEGPVRLLRYRWR